VEHNIFPSGQNNFYGTEWIWRIATVSWFLLWIAWKYCCYLYFAV